MSGSTATSGRRGVDELCAAVGLAYVLVGAWAAASPRTFAAVLADFGPADDHLVRDFAAASAAIGLGLLMAARRETWRVPVLALSALWSGLHALSHVASIDDATPFVVGPIEAVLLLLVTALLVIRLVQTHRTQETAS